MFVLVYAPHGTVGEDGSRAWPFDDRSRAHDVMERQARFAAKSDYGDEDSCAVEDDHATAGLNDPCAPEWHIYDLDEWKV